MAEGYQMEGGEHNKIFEAQFNRHTEEMESRKTTSDIVVQPSRIFRARSARMSSSGECDP